MNEAEQLARAASDKLAMVERTELQALAGRVRERLQRTSADILAVGGDLVRAKTLLGHGGFGAWLDSEFGLSRRSAEQFMSAHRRFGERHAEVLALPVGALVELSAPSVPDELVERVLSGDVEPTVSAIRRERATETTDERSYKAAATFMETLGSFKGTDVDYAAGIAAQVLRGWPSEEDRVWFAGCLALAAEMLRENSAQEIPALEFGRTTVRRLKERG